MSYIYPPFAPSVAPCACPYCQYHRVPQVVYPNTTTITWDSPKKDTYVPKHRKPGPAR